VSPRSTVTDGHEVSTPSTRQDCARRLLAEIEAGNGTSQRTLARRAGAALGLTNLVLRKLVRKGWVRITRIKRNRVRYLITPAGLAEKARISTAYLAYTTRFYVEARDRVRDRLAVLSAGWPMPVDGGKRVGFYGATDVAEIGFVCLQETDLIVTAVFDGDASRRFFGTPVHGLSALDDPASWNAFGVLAVMAFEETRRREAELHLDAICFPPERRFWI